MIGNNQNIYVLNVEKDSIQLKIEKNVCFRCVEMYKIANFAFTDLIIIIFAYHADKDIDLLMAHVFKIYVLLKIALLVVLIKSV